MTEVRWTNQAIEDAQSIGDFIARDSPRYASFVVERLVGAVERLETLPRLGRVVSEFRDSRLREVISGSYRIGYQLLDDTVEAPTVYHGAQIFIDPRGG